MNWILRKRILIILLSILSTLLTSGCAARKYILEDQGKTECFLDQEDAAKFTYNNQSYIILNDTVNEDSTGEWIGFISKYAAVTEDYRITEMKDMDVNIVANLRSLAGKSSHAAYYVPYLNVYSYKDRTDSTDLVVEADHELHRAVLSENIKDGDFKIIFTRKSGSDTFADSLPVINQKDVGQLIWNGELYAITDRDVPNDKLGGFLCTLSENITFDAETGRKLTLEELTHIELLPEDIRPQTRENWMFGSVYKVRKTHEDCLAVEINDKYVYAVLKN